MAADVTGITAASIVKAYNRLKGKRSTWEAVWQDLADYIIPNKANIARRSSPGAKTTVNLYDSTAINSCELLAANLHGTMTNPATVWFGLQMRDDELQADEEVQEWLEECAKRMMKALNQSNFNSEVQECFLDLVAFGTGCLYEEQKEPGFGGRFGGLTFRSFSVGQFVIEEDADGIVKGLMYEVEMTCGAAFRKWGTKTSQRTQERAKDKPEDPLVILHCVRPYSKEEAKGKETKPFESYIIELQQKHLIVEGQGFETFPFHVPRWRKSSGEEYGRGPGHTALPDIRTLNRAKELGLAAWAKVINPAMQIEDDGVIMNVSLTPGSLNTVSKVGAIAPIESGAKFDVHFFQLDKLKADVRSVFFTDQLVMREGPQMTAEEVRTRYELMQRLIGPSIGKLESELLNSLIDRTFDIMLRAGAFSEMPEQVRAMSAEGKGKIDVEYTGPLAKAQRAHEAAAVAEVFAFASGIQPVAPEAMDVLNADESVRTFADIKGMPKKCIRSVDGVSEIRKQRSAQVEKAQALQSAEQASAIGLNAAKADQVAASMPAPSAAMPPPAEMM